MATASGENAITSVVPALNALLADLFALYLKTKNYHWHMTGPHFRDYHLLLDEQAGEIFASTDDVAERARKLGGNTLRSIGDIARLQRLKDDDRETAEPADMLRALRDDTDALVASLHELKAISDAAGDNATSGIVDTWTDQAERRAWFLAEIVRGR